MSMKLVLFSLFGLTMPVQNAAVETTNAPDAATSEAAIEYGPYFVFFGFDSSAIDRDGEAIVTQVVADFAAVEGGALVLTGHTDRAGASAYNKRLSTRRVEAVRAALVAKGVPASRITIGPDGEGSPLIATGDGVREAQNRRVEIHFQ